jgi:ferritin-like metal-binding protein YciE
MATDDIQEQIVKYLTDMHSTEENAITQLKTGSEAGSEPRLATVLREHLVETQEHERLVGERLEIAAYRSLRTVARRANDETTAALAGRILREEEAASAKLDGLLEDAALAGLSQAA